MGNHAGRWNGGYRSWRAGSCVKKYHQNAGQPRGFPRANWRKRYASDAQIGAAIGMDRLPRDVARRGTAEEAHHGRDILGTALFAAYRMVGRMMRGFRLVLRPRRADQAGNDAVHGDSVRRQVMGERAGEADDAGLGRHHMGAIRGSGMRAEAADVDDRARAGLPQRRQASLHAMKGTVEGHIEYFAPGGIVYLGERLFAA